MQAFRLLAEALQLAARLGYRIREDTLDGAGGGHCVLAGQKWLLLDVTQSAEEQLSDVVDALRSEPALWQAKISPLLAQRLQIAKAA